MGVAVCSSPGVTRGPLPWQWKVTTAEISPCCPLLAAAGDGDGEGSLSGLFTASYKYSTHLSHHALIRLSAGSDEDRYS